MLLRNATGWIDRSDSAGPRGCLCWARQTNYTGRLPASSESTKLRVRIRLIGGLAFQAIHTPRMILGSWITV
jgi:hypothetical protein